MAMKIKIVAVPPGEAPEWVREEWVGLVLPVDETPITTFCTVIEVVSGKRANLDIEVYRIKKEEAIGILGKNSPEAADWWKRNRIIADSDWLLFAQGVCEIVED